MPIPRDRWVPFRSGVKQLGSRWFAGVYLAIVALTVAALAFAKLGELWVIVILMVTTAIITEVYRAHQRGRQWRQLEGPLELKELPPACSDDELQRLQSAWKELLGDGAQWVMFSYGTCVVFEQPAADPQQAATEILAEQGPVRLGTCEADFRIRWHSVTGMHLVGYVQPAIYNLVSLPQHPLIRSGEELAGILGRVARMCDAKTLKVVHVENGSRHQTANV